MKHKPRGWQLHRKEWKMNPPPQNSTKIGSNIEQQALGTKPELLRRFLYSWTLGTLNWEVESCICSLQKDLAQELPHMETWILSFEAETLPGEIKAAQRSK
jgi:hypothetical protein